MSIFTPSIQQAAAIAELRNGSGSIVVESVAGSGKTSTLIGMMGEVKSNQTGAFCAFNKAIATEVEYKTGDKFPNFKVGTVHSFGFGAIRRTVSRVKVDGYKLRNLAQQEFNGEYEILRQFVEQAVSMAKRVGIGACLEDNIQNWIDIFDHHDLWDLAPKNVDDNQAIDACQYLLNVSNSIKNIIDFDDMVYLPVLNRMKIWQYDYVFLDEAQDTNATRLALVEMMLKPNGRLVAVGDPHQAIYGFTGADSRSLDNIQTKFNAKVRPLTVTFRCPKAIVKVANQWVHHIEADDSAPEGVVDTIELADLAKHVSANDAVVCRNTKPLVEAAYNLIRNKIPAKVEGRSIGEGLIKLTQKWKKVKNVTELADKLQDWQENEVAKAIERGRDSRAQAIIDQVETLLVFIDECAFDDPISVLTRKISDLFGDTKNSRDVVTLCTIHRSKGREWHRVFALGMDTYSPSKYAKKEWEMEQEMNLLYVQVTRAKHHLTTVNVPAKSK